APTAGSGEVISPGLAASASSAMPESGRAPGRRGSPGVAAALPSGELPVPAPEIGRAGPRPGAFLVASPRPSPAAGADSAAGPYGPAPARAASPGGAAGEAGRAACRSRR